MWPHMRLHVSGASELVRLAAGISLTSEASPEAGMFLWPRWETDVGGWNTGPWASPKLMSGVVPF